MGSSSLRGLILTFEGDFLGNETEAESGGSRMLRSIGDMFSELDRNLERRFKDGFCFDFVSKLLNGTEEAMLPKNLLFSKISELDFAMIGISRRNR